MSGWYYLDPLGEAPSRGAWSWETASLLMETRAQAHADRTLAAWTTRTVALRPTDAPGVALGADAWELVVAMARSSTTAALGQQLGWTPGRLLAALTEMEQRGVLEPERPLAIPAPSAPRPAPPAARHHGPLSPPPPISAAALITPITEASGARGRRRSARRTSR
ncbi:MAG: hypothetical protein R2702_08645 [Acidimicrobiales bacterium]